MQYGYKKKINLSFAEAEKRVREELEKEGFGVITEINAKETFKKKLGIDFENYLILGACHPVSAHKVLEANKELGLLLPCNVIIYEEKDEVFVSAILPKNLMITLGGESLIGIAEEIEEKLKRVVDNI